LLVDVDVGVWCLFDKRGSSFHEVVELSAHSLELFAKPCVLAMQSVYMAIVWVRASWMVKSRALLSLPLL
jgi:hypothetical protein